MDPIELLTEKAQQAANQIINLKKHNQHLLAELELIRREIGRQNKILRENERYKRERSRIRAKLEKLHKKIDKLMESKETPPPHEQLN